jgi:hypothetical protein
VLAVDTVSPLATKWATAGVVGPRTPDNAFGLPGASAIGRAVETLAAGFTAFTLLEPWVVQKPITITDLRLTTNSTSAGATLVYGIYVAGADWTATSLLYQSSTIALDTSGEKTTSGLSIVLAPGRYLGAWNMSTMVQTVGWFGINPFIGVVGNTTSNMAINLELNSVFPTGPETPIIRTASSGTGLRYYLSAKWTA